MFDLALALVLPVMVLVSVLTTESSWVQAWCVVRPTAENGQ